MWKLVSSSFSKSCTFQKNNNFQLPRTPKKRSNVTPKWEVRLVDASHSARSVGFTAYNSAFLGWRQVAAKAVGFGGPSLESFNGSRVHLLTVIFLRGVFSLPVPKITWFKGGKKNNPLPKTKQRDWGGFLESFGSIQIPTCLYKNHKRHISCCTWTCMAPFPIHILPNLRWKHRKKANPLRGLVKVT